MAIPDYQTIMLPLLKFMGDEKEHDVRDMVDHLAGVFHLSDEERRTPLPSGNDIAFDNKVKWSRLYLGKARLLESRRRGYWKITESGLQVLSQNPPRIDIKFLEQFPEFRAWKSTFSKEAKRLPAKEPIEPLTPEEALENAYKNLRDALASDLIEHLKAISPKQFENIIVDLLIAMGYGGSRREAARAIGGSGDQGIDAVINEDKLGLEVIYVQAKKWKGTVGRPEIQKFAGALQGHHARKGIFITTADFSEEAIDFASRVDNKIVLIDGQTLVQHMIDHNIGVGTVHSYEVKKIDSDYFVEE